MAAEGGHPGGLHQRPGFPEHLGPGPAARGEDCFAGSLAKGPILDQLCAKYGLEPRQVAHLGDDLPDLPLLRQVGLACCPADAVAEVREACHLVVPVQGGAGVLRPVAERILKAQGCWEAVLAGY